MEKERDLPTLREVYDAYRWEGNDVSKTEAVSTWEVPAMFGTELKAIMTNIAREYIHRPMPLYDYQGSEDPPPDIEIDKLTLYENQMNCDPSVQCSIFEIYGYSCVDDRRNKQWALWLQLQRDKELLCASFLLHSNTGSWNFSHRIVPTPHRGKKLFGHFSGAFETFVSERCFQERRRQALFLRTGQPDVAIAFSKRGYMPTDAENQKRLENILHPDDRFTLHYALRPNWSAGGNTHGSVAQKLTSPYCFEKKVIGDDPSLRTMGNALRVALQREFLYPETTIGDHVGEIGKGIRKLF